MPVARGAGRDKICNPLVAATRGGGRKFFRETRVWFWFGWCQWPTPHPQGRIESQHTDTLAEDLSMTFRARASALVVLSHQLHPTRSSPDEWLTRYHHHMAPVAFGVPYMSKLFFNFDHNVRPDSETNSGPAHGLPSRPACARARGVM